MNFYKNIDEKLFLPLIENDIPQLHINGNIIARVIQKLIQPIFTSSINITIKGPIVEYGMDCSIDIIDNDDINNIANNFNKMIKDYIDRLSAKFNKNNIKLPVSASYDFGFYFDPFIVKQKKFGFFGYMSIPHGLVS
jgi:hypothetical protein